MRRERFSELTYTGSKKISGCRSARRSSGSRSRTSMRSPRFSVGSRAVRRWSWARFSPRTRNAQVEMYQSGEVGYLVATDAIGMGLNLDIDHVAFSGLRKFDGRRMRELQPNRVCPNRGAGRPAYDRRHLRRHRRGPAPRRGARRRHHRTSLRAPESVSNGATPRWSSAAWNGSSTSLGTALGRRTARHGARVRRPAGAEDAFRRRQGRAPARVTALGEAALERLPGPRLFAASRHAEHAARSWRAFLGSCTKRARCPTTGWPHRLRGSTEPMATLDALSKRLAYIRTWTYVAQRKGWTGDNSHWR